MANVCFGHDDDIDNISLYCKLFKAKASSSLNKNIAIRKIWHFHRTNNLKFISIF